MSTEKKEKAFAAISIVFIIIILAADTFGTQLTLPKEQRNFGEALGMFLVFPFLGLLMLLIVYRGDERKPTWVRAIGWMILLSVIIIGSILTMF